MLDSTEIFSFNIKIGKEFISCLEFYKVLMWYSTSTAETGSKKNEYECLTLTEWHESRLVEGISESYFAPIEQKKSLKTEAISASSQ